MEIKEKVLDAIIAVSASLVPAGLPFLISYVSPEEFLGPLTVSASIIFLLLAFFIAIQFAFPDRPLKLTARSLVFLPLMAVAGWLISRVKLPVSPNISPQAWHVRVSLHPQPYQPNRWPSPKSSSTFLDTNIPVTIIDGYGNYRAPLPEHGVVELPLQSGEYIKIGVCGIFFSYNVPEKYRYDLQDDGAGKHAPFSVDVDLDDLAKLTCEIRDQKEDERQK